MTDTIFEKTCRTCNSESTDLRNIFETSLLFDAELPSIVIYEALNKLGFMEKDIEEGDNLPKNICNACFERLKLSFNFKRLIRESQSEFEVALKYEKRRHTNSIDTSEVNEQPEDDTIIYYDYDIPYENDQTFYINSDNETIDINDMIECDVEEENVVEEEDLVEEEEEEDGAIKEEHIKESSKKCFVCNRSYKSLEALGFHQSAMHRGISILQE